MWLYLLIILPFLFLLGTIVSALKEQKKLENGLLKKVLEQRALERERAFRQKAKFSKKDPDHKS